MEDKEIISLFFARQEEAISRSRDKFGRLILALAMRILGDERDAAETENDTYLSAWNTIPPKEPIPLAPYFSLLARNGAIDRLRERRSEKRGGGEFDLCLEELSEIVSGEEKTAERVILEDAIRRYLAALSPRSRAIFLMRYWWGGSLREIAAETGLSEKAVKARLHRLRERLKNQLLEEGFEL